MKGIKRLEWHETEHIWIWRVYYAGEKTSVFIPYREGERPAGLTDEQYRKELERVKMEDSEIF